ncbi:hypothetical protein Hamer_G006349 [Homarus americanus]|uniref:Uncharacterized protein n=1 Tax=Homarus americanus TaxID=6706 RepID=A0A8J5JNR6_HOMAM|nr:hypothetical protein Hamer_G006349 [Homarus americanus]
MRQEYKKGGVSKRGGLVRNSTEIDYCPLDTLEGGCVAGETLLTQNTRPGSEEKDTLLLSAQRVEGRRSPASALRVHFESPTSSGTLGSDTEDHIAPAFNETVL